MVKFTDRGLLHRGVCIERLRVVRGGVLLLRPWRTVLRSLRGPLPVDSALVGGELLAGKETCMELDLLDPLLRLLVVGTKEVLRAVSHVESEDKVPLGVVLRLLYTGLVNHDR